MDIQESDSATLAKRPIKLYITTWSVSGCSIISITTAIKCMVVAIHPRTDKEVLLPSSLFAPAKVSTATLSSQSSRVPTAMITRNEMPNARA